MATPATELIPIPLLKALENRVLPWQQQWGMDRCLIAPYDLDHPRLLQKWLSTGGTVDESPIRGKKIYVKGPRKYRNRSLMIARWPEDRLESRRTAMLGYVLAGHADLQMGNKMVHCSAGHSMILLPGLPFPDGSNSHLVGENAHNGHCEMLWISGGTDFGIGCWMCHSEGERHFEKPAERCYVSDPAAVTFYEALMNEAAQPGGAHRDICNHLFQALLLSLCREIQVGRVFQFTHQRYNPLEMGNFSNFLNPIPAVRDYVKYNLHLPLLIDDVARQFFMSRTEFTRRFKAESGKSFHDYLTDQRVDEAKRLLETTAWSVSMIERAVGFNSSRLRVLFKERLGLSPQQYRRQRQVSQVEENPPKRTRN